MIQAGSVLGLAQTIGGAPRKERKTAFGKMLQKITTGSTFEESQARAASPIQQKPLASGNISFGKEQRDRNLLNIAALVVVAVLGWRFFGAKKRRRR